MELLVAVDLRMSVSSSKSTPQALKPSCTTLPAGPTEQSLLARRFAIRTATFTARPHEAVWGLGLARFTKLTLPDSSLPCILSLAEHKATGLLLGWYAILRAIFLEPASRVDPTMRVPSSCLVPQASSECFMNSMFSMERTRKV